MRDRQVDKLNCRVGDIAMVVNSQESVNHGTIVYIKSAKGTLPRPQSGSTAFIWNIIVITSGKKLRYEDGGKSIEQSYGVLADCALMPITPHKKRHANTKQLNLEFGS
jgi:hypothetical protein